MKDDDDDDAEDMVVMEAKGSGNDFIENGDYKIDNQLMQEHGHLVAQILETQRELVNTDNVDVLPKKVDIVKIKTYYFRIYTIYAVAIFIFKCIHIAGMGRYETRSRSNG